MNSTLIIRSYNRIVELQELVRIIIKQDVRNKYEIIIIEQTSGFNSNNWILFSKQELGNKCKVKISYDREILIIESNNDAVDLKLYSFNKPLGGAKARNEGVKRATSDLCIFIDDDDLPGNHTWIQQHIDRHKEEPNLIGLTGRHISLSSDKCPYVRFMRPFIRRKVLNYSLLKTPYTFARFDESVNAVKWIHGTNSSIKKEWIEKVGGWDETIRNQDEHSLAFKLHKVMPNTHYFAFDSSIPLIRRTDIPGGMGKRTFSISREVRNQWQFFTRIVFKYFPIRFLLLFPMYFIMILIRLIQKSVSSLAKPRRTDGIVNVNRV